MLCSRCLLVMILTLQLCFSMTVGMLTVLGVGVLVCYELPCMLTDNNNRLLPTFYP